MKKLVRNIGCVLLLAVAMSSCKKQLEDMYTDPDKTTNPTIEKLFSGMMDNNRVRPQYWDMRTLQFLQTGVYSQSITGVNDQFVYRQTDGYVQSRWNDFYVPNNFTNNQGDYNSGSGPMAQYRTIMRLYNALPQGAEQENVEIFTWAAYTLLLDQASQMVDMFGDIPYSEAGGLDVSNTITNAKFDGQKELYDSIMNGLFQCQAYFSSAFLNSSAKASFSVQDYVNHGDIVKWRRYANSLRLRLLMRTSFVDEATSKAAVQQILAQDQQFLLIDGNRVGDNYNPGNTDVLLMQTTVYTDNLSSAFGDLKMPYAAPDYMLNTLMLPANDPRIPFMFDKFGRTDDNKAFIPNKTYRAMPADWGSTTQLDSLTSFSTLDSTTYRYNSKIPGVMMSAPEVNFLLAEAVERWGTVGSSLSAQQYYELGIRQSIAFLYFMYNLNPNKAEALTQPSTADVDAFIAQPTIAYTGTTQEKLEKIWNQKWLYFGFTQTPQAWAETRRTDYPKFPKTYASTLSGYESAPSRFRYPASEISYNSSYKDVQAKDTRDAKIFWDVPQP
ncbi:Susd and RagB outer membrane lipoprotein [Chitinophaga sp. CF118]|uniref:SusD/RagB family nutrient-binding outer membrane lipoprotein n=1 Tax=Chitinophaga sp. CF118 TaxID=1884367 RepID=UPI0008E57675|nr:SusD/RagB family nutrient-binding outer membrane lipoprotein [Chitinophaga sp. CF118]SFD17885.1 Susd and RagB outer membrane lipoprotein [Chitinophaga sp. CF118]